VEKEKEEEVEEEEEKDNPPPPSCPFPNLIIPPLPGEKYAMEHDFFMLEEGEGEVGEGINVCNGEGIRGGYVVVVDCCCEEEGSVEGVYIVSCGCVGKGDEEGREVPMFGEEKRGGNNVVIVGGVDVCSGDCMRSGNPVWDVICCGVCCVGCCCCCIVGGDV
jgi:hypothetical protein